MIPSHYCFDTFRGKRVHLGVTGSVAAFKALELLRALVHLHIQVGVTLTDGARKFVTDLSFGALGADPVHGDLFSSGMHYDHLEPSVADAFVVAPATANILAKIAHGLADDLLSCQVLAYAGPNQWVLTPVSAEERTGAWSQTVWQTDDSPRYGGVGRWTYENGLRVWTSEPTWRPLARRDAVLNPVYDRYLGTNRHALTPNGWVHIQDNMKMDGRAGGEPVAIVQEDVVNTYDRSTSYSPKAGDDYWAATQEYWAAVRAAWDAVIARDKGVYVEEEAQTGVVTGPPLMNLAQKIQDGELTTAVAIIQARAVINTATTR